jgi:apolipoprotein D and lipocalin family protein
MIMETGSLIVVTLVAFVFALPGVSLAGEGKNDKSIVMTTVERVDLEKYAGVWYEYSRIPNSFQDDCLQNTTATYHLREDGRVDVTNRCIDAVGDTIEANGIAQVVDTETRSKLEVSFVRLLGFNLFWGDYWIIGLAEDYRYAVVGVPSRKYGWILSRKPTVSEEDLTTIENILKANGYNHVDFLISKNNY